MRAEFAKLEQYAVLAAKNVLNVKDLALLLGISPKTIRNNIDSYPHYRNGHGVWFKRSEIEEWQCKVKHTPVEL